MATLPFGGQPTPSIGEDKQLNQDEEYTRHVENGLEGNDAQKKANISQVLAGGLGMLSDGYQNSLLSTSNVIFKKIYGSTYSNDFAAQIANALLVGIILGEATMGFVADIVGRRAAVLITTLILVTGSVLGTVAHAPTPVGLFWFLTVARGITGFGSGGEYPAAQTAAIEGADAHYTLKNRGFVFLICSLGSLLAGQILTYVVCLIGLAASQYDNTSDVTQLKKLEVVWRCEWAFGAILPMLVLVFRMKRMSAVVFQENAIKSKIPYWLFIKRYWPRLLGSIGSFFFSQFIGYPGGTFSGIIVGGLNNSTTTISTIGWQLLLVSFNIPGTLFGAWCSRFLDRRWQLGIGFAGYVIFGLVIGLAYEKVSAIVPLFTVLYGLYLSIGTFGPGNLNGLLVSEAYPTSMRGTAHGMVAAIGKVGGVCGTFAFTQVAASLGVKYTFIIGGCISLVGVFCAAFLTPNTLKHNLEDIDAEWREYLIQNGWKGQFGEKPHEVLPSAEVSAAVSATTLQPKV